MTDRFKVEYFYGLNRFVKEGFKDLPSCCGFIEQLPTLMRISSGRYLGFAQARILKNNVYID